MQEIIKTSEIYFRKYFSKLLNLKLDLSYNEFCNLDRIRTAIRDKKYNKAKKIYNKELKYFIYSYEKLEKLVLNYYKIN